MATSARDEMNLEYDEKVKEGVYSNAMFIAHSHSDFVIDFAQIMPGLDRPKVYTRAILAPEHAKRLLMALNENIANYERVYGKIKIQGQNNPDMIAPFGDGNISGGEA
jgi:ribonuclease BN (tRNA processing enzyme)